MEATFPGDSHLNSLAISLTIFILEQPTESLEKLAKEAVGDYKLVVEIRLGVAQR